MEHEHVSKRLRTADDVVPPSAGAQNGDGGLAEPRKATAYRGIIVHSLALGQLELIEDGAVIVGANGCVVSVIDVTVTGPGALAECGASVVDLRGRLIMPGFVDGHAHAPQYAFTGTGMDLPLLQWLETYTFPCESKFKDIEFARDVYTKSVARHLRSGTTTCSYFATIHVEACKVLVDVVKKAGQRAYVGKVSMDRNSPDYLIETTDDAVRDAEAFAKYVLADSSGREGAVAAAAAAAAAEAAAVAVEAAAAAAKEKEMEADDGAGGEEGGAAATGSDGAESVSAETRSTMAPSESISNLTDVESDSSSEEDAAARARCTGSATAAAGAVTAAAAAAAAGHALVTPVLTPRFVPSCTAPLLSALGALSARLALPIQSHLSESPGEIAWVRELHPECDSYLGVYERYGLLTERSYFAHCVHCTGGERAMLHAKGGGVIHCPSSNFMLQSGVCNVRRYLRDGCKVGLGTDVAGGFSASMLDCLRQTVIASRVCAFGLGQEEGEEPIAPITLQEAFHLATVGGAEAIGLGHAVGNFLPGKQFDALVVSEDVESLLGPAGAPYHIFPQLNQGSRDRFEKFLFLGDDRNIRQVYVGGRRVV